jgi:DNA adenine methylase
VIRYPGSKDKITKKILRHFPHWLTDELFQSKRIEYREPFFGGGAIGFDVLAMLPSYARIWVNDKDFGMACLWRSVYQNHEQLIRLVSTFKPTTDAFYQFKEEDGRTDIDPTVIGFRKFALHQISFSGLGAKAGGPLGGRRQSSKFNVDCRWNPNRHCREIIAKHNLFSRFRDVKISSGDFAKLIDGAPSSAFIYLDPPYYEKGGQLYKFNMSEDDHARLAALLKSCSAPWVLSYDDHEVVRGLYSWADTESVELTYTIATANDQRRKNHEIIIKPKSLAVRAA